MAEAETEKEMNLSAEEEKDRKVVEQSEVVKDILQLISSHRKLDRDLGVRKLQILLSKLSAGSSDVNNQDKNDIYNYVNTQLRIIAPADLPSSDATTEEPRLSGLRSRSLSVTSSTSGSSLSGWEIKNGCLLACYPLTDFISRTANKSVEDEEFLKDIQEITLNLLKDDSVYSVQVAAGSLLGYLSKVVGDEVYQKSRETIFELITKNLRTSNEELMSPEDQLQSAEQGFDIHLPASLIRDKVAKESMGWHSLEPSMKCLLCMIENLNTNFCKFVDEQLICLMWASLSHHNRFVRELGFQIVNSLIIAAPSVVEQHSEKLATYLSNGLSDNWNQVRLAASIATRKFLLTYNIMKDNFYPILLPKLCLNRYYKAEGVRVFSQESWRLIFGTEGRNYVAKYFPFVVDYYVSATSSTNSAEREAACSGISELIQKIDKTVVVHKVQLLLETLNCRAKDENWSVRDAANLAFGNCTKYYPDIARQFLDDFYPHLFKTLEDPIPLVRQGAASSLAQIVLAYGGEAQSIVIDKVVSGLKSIDKLAEVRTDEDKPLDATEPSTSTSTSDSVQHQQEQQVIKGIEISKETVCTAEDTAQHESSCEFAGVPGKIQILTMESFKAAAVASSPSTCPGCLQSKSTQPWQLIDGCLYLIGALAEITPCKSELPPLIPLMIQALNVKTYPERYIVLETLCKIIPVLATAIGKRPFKEFLNLLFDPIVDTVECSNPVTSATGKQAIRFLSEFIGPNILKSRVEMHDPRYVNLFQSCILTGGHSSSTSSNSSSQ